MERTKLREFFKRVSKREVFNDQVCRHMALFSLYKLLEFTLVRGLKKNVEQKYLWIENSVKIERSRPLFKKLEFLRKWKDHYRYRQKQYLLANFSLIMIKNAVIKPYFNVLKDKRAWRFLKKGIIESK